MMVLIREYGQACAAAGWEMGGAAERCPLCRRVVENKVRVL